MILYPVTCCGVNFTDVPAGASARCPKCGKWRRPEVAT